MNQSNTDKINKVKQFGYYSKGLVYSLIALLAAFAALGLGGDVKSETEVVHFITDLPAGKLISFIVAFGLLAFSLWRFYEAIVDPYHHENKKRIRSRLVYAYSGILYLIIAYSFAKPLLSMQGSSNENSKKAFLNELLEKDYGIYILWIIAIAIGANAIWQFYLSYSGKYMKLVDDNPNGKEYTFVRRIGKYGYMARGIVFGILSFFMVKVCISKNSDLYKGTDGALEYVLKLDYGPFLMGTIAIGMLGYGLFCMMVARHSNLTNA